MIKLILDITIEKEFYTEDAEELALKLGDLGYELERDARLVDEKLTSEKLNALLRLLKQAKPKVLPTVTIET